MNRAVAACREGLVLALGGVGRVVGLRPTAAHADDTTAAWSVTPPMRRGHRRPDPVRARARAGRAVEQHVLSRTPRPSNASSRSTGRTGSAPRPAGTTSPGRPAAHRRGLLGHRPAGPTVTIGPLSTATVAFTVAVPADVDAGGPPREGSSSPRPRAGDGRPAWSSTRGWPCGSTCGRGEVIPALEVRRSAPTTRSPPCPSRGDDDRELRGRQHRQRQGHRGPAGAGHGPFGISVAELEGDETREVLPGTRSP